MRNLTLMLALLVGTAPAMAHFGMVLPSDPVVTQEDGPDVELTFGFGHPFAPEGLEMEAPQRVIVVHGEENDEITGDLIAADFHGAAGFTATYTLGRPGAYIVAMAPEPYFEEAEDSFIKHYTKSFISAFDDTSGWDTELGLETEIIPLTSPFGLWAGNVFKGVVLRDGEPVPFVEVEVEHYNQTGATAPTELHITQTIKADANGVFTYATPAPGWWGFAALTPAGYRLPFGDEAKEVELGAVVWVHFEAWGQ